MARVRSALISEQPLGISRWPRFLGLFSDVASICRGKPLRQFGRTHLGIENSIHIVDETFGVPLGPPGVGPTCRRMMVARSLDQKTNKLTLNTGFSHRRPGYRSWDWRRRTGIEPARGPDHTWWPKPYPAVRDERAEARTLESDRRILSAFVRHLDERKSPP